MVKKLPPDTKNKIIIDWFSFTCHMEKEQLLSFLDLGHLNFEECNGAKGFARRLYFDGISVHFGFASDPELVWCEMSGQGCRNFETYSSLDFSFLFHWILNSQGLVHVTRLDIAYDDMDDKLLSMPVIINDVRLGFYKFRGQYWEVVESSKGSSVIFGSPQSDVRIRIYDKSAERGLPDDFHWVRVELQLRRDRALGFIKSVSSSSIGITFRGVLHNYLVFCVHTEDTNKQRWSVSEYWSNFLDGVGKISIWSSPGIEYNLEHCRKYVFMQAGNAVDALVQVLGKDKFFDELNMRPINRNPKYDKLVNDHLLNGGVVEL